MITDFIITVIYNVVLVIVNFIALAPDVSLNTDLINGLSDIAPYYSSLAIVFPIGTLLLIVAFELAFESAVLSYKLIRWAYQKIPFIN